MIEMIYKVEEIHGWETQTVGYWHFLEEAQEAVGGLPCFKGAPAEWYLYQDQLMTVPFKETFDHIKPYFRITPVTLGDMDATYKLFVEFKTPEWLEGK